MEYLSTRGFAPRVEFEQALLTGLAPDGGLYLPKYWPQFERNTIEELRGAPYADVAAKILSRFTKGSFDENELCAIAKKVYARFDHPETAPLTKVGEEDWILELFHGPTLAFKDFAMQMLGALFDVALTRSEKYLTIIAATSGDTGAAAIDALKACERVRVVVLHPEGRVTDVQRKMMTTIIAPNVCNIAVKGDFDNCQAIVKTLFADREFVEKVNLGGVNSINWARLAAQIVYYFTSAAALTQGDEHINYVVPTGNFGDIFAGYAAKRMGLNVGTLVTATNSNDILHRAISKGDYSSGTVTPTVSPSMDIQVASNFERLLSEALGRDHAALNALMESFSQKNTMTLNERLRDTISKDFLSFAADETATLDEIQRHYDQTGALIDPHTAVARVAARQLRATGHLAGKVVTLSTAHPAKFPQAVEQATGKYPALPPAHQNLFELPEEMLSAEANVDAVKQEINSAFGF